jgi:hypothetical protein
VGKRLAGPDETSLASTLASSAQTSVQQIPAIDLISEIDLNSETPESSVGTLPALRNLGGASLFGSRNDDVRTKIDSPAAARRTIQTSRSIDRAGSKSCRSKDRTKAMTIAWQAFPSLRKERGSK